VSLFGLLMSCSVTLRRSVACDVIQYSGGTERRGRVVNNSASYSGGPGLKSRLGYRLFSQSTEENVGIVAQSRQRQVPSRTFPIHHSTIIYYRIIRRYIVWATQKASLNKLQKDGHEWE
jgi:hypothetical protein